MVEEVIKVEDTELSITEPGAEEWSETDPRWTDDTMPPTPALRAEIEEVLSKDERIARLEQLRNARLTVNSLQDELDERADDEEDKDTPEDTDWSTNSKYDSKIEEDEAECNSECESVATIDYEFPIEKQKKSLNLLTRKVRSQRMMRRDSCRRE